MDEPIRERKEANALAEADGRALATFVLGLATDTDCILLPDDGGDDWLDHDGLEDHVDDTGCIRCAAGRLVRDLGITAGEVAGG